MTAPCAVGIEAGCLSFLPSASPNFWDHSPPARSRIVAPVPCPLLGASDAGMGNTGLPAAKIKRGSLAAAELCWEGFRCSPPARGTCRSVWIRGGSCHPCCHCTGPVWSRNSWTAGRPGALLNLGLIPHQSLFSQGQAEHFLHQLDWKDEPSGGARNSRASHCFCRVQLTGWTSWNAYCCLCVNENNPS